MLNLNFNSALHSTTHLGVPSFGGMPAAPGAGFGGLDALLAQTMQQLTQSMSTLMAQMAKQTSLLGGVKFGGGGQGAFGSPLVDFLGGTNGSLTTGRPAKAPKGSRIPGGKAIYRKGMFHKGAPGAPNTYAFENSPAGIAFAAKKGYSSIDLDMQITKDGVPVATHWSKPLEKDGFYDPKGKIKKGTKVKDMTLKQVMRLRNKDGKSRIYPMSTMIQLLKKHGIAGDLEAKDDNRFATNAIMSQLADMVRAAGIKANLKTINRGGRSEKIVDKAQQHGFYVKIALPKAGDKRYRGYGG